MRHRRRNGTVGLSGGVAGLCVLALFPTGAFAATANTRIKRVFYDGGPAEVNKLTISLSGGNYKLSDPGATITAEPPCTSVSATVTCPAAGIIGVTVSAGDGADSVTNATSTATTRSRAALEMTHCEETRESTPMPVAPATTSSTSEETGGTS
jgi:hypothetical protein